MPRLAIATVAVLLFSAATPVLAHGFEAMMLSLAMVGSSVGFLGGAVTAAFRFKAIVGLAGSLALLFAGGIGIVLFESGSYHWKDIGALALWLGLFAALPLAAAFLVAFGGISVARNRVWPIGNRSDPAP